MLKLDCMNELIARKWLHKSVSRVVGARHSHQGDVKSRLNRGRSQSVTLGSQANASPLQMHRGEQAAVDDVHLSRGIGAGVCGEEKGRLGELIRLSLSAKGELGVDDG